MKRAKKACEELAAEMEKKVIVTESIRSVEPEHLARDFFLDDSNGGKKYKERFIECISDLVMVKSLPECFHIKKHLPIDMVGKWCYYSYQHTEKVGNNMVNIFEELVRHNFRFGRMCSRDYCRNLVNTLTIGRR